MTWVAIVAGLAFLALALMFASRFGGDPGISSSPLIGKDAPTEPIALMDGSGTTTIGDYRGDIVVVNFWASWCLGCRTEHDALTQAADDYEDFGTTFVAVNYQDSPDRAEAFLDELGRSQSTIYTVDDGSATAVDREGVVVGKVSGPLTYNLLSRTIEQIIVGDTIGDISTGEVENR
jgi:cytochrome c biogenesis protein CcmG/thiol:disulfide interchange protein DsbE